MARVVGRTVALDAERGATVASLAGGAATGTTGLNAVPASGMRTSALGTVTWRAATSSGVATWAAIAGAAAVTAGFLGSSDLLLEVSRANSLVWALALWLVAGIAMTTRPARPWLAGVALFVAALCRLETIALDALAVAILVVAALRARKGEWPVLTVGLIELAEHLARRRMAVVRDGAVGVLVALAAIPLILAHDWLLTGNPLWFMSVPAGYTAIYNPDLTAVGPVAYAGTFIGHEAATIAGVALIVLAGDRRVGARPRPRDDHSRTDRDPRPRGHASPLPPRGARDVHLESLLRAPRSRAPGRRGRRRWLDLGPRPRGPGARLNRGRSATVIEVRAEGAGSLAGLGLAGRADVRPTRPPRPAMMAAGLGAALVAALVVGVLSGAPLPLDRRATTELANVRLSSRQLELAMPVLGGPLLAAAVQAGDVGTVNGAPAVDLRTVAVLAPSRDVSRIAVEKGSRVTLVGDMYAFLLTAGFEQLRPGQYVIHDGSVDRPVALFKPFEVDSSPESTTVGGVTMTPHFRDALASEPSTGIWVVEVR